MIISTLYRFYLVSILSVKAVTMAIFKFTGQAASFKWTDSAGNGSFVVNNELPLSFRIDSGEESYLEITQTPAMMSHWTIKLRSPTTTEILLQKHHL